MAKLHTHQAIGPDGQVATRTSTSRVYSHCVFEQRESGWQVRGWCGTEARARAEASQGIYAGFDQKRQRDIRKTVPTQVVRASVVTRETTAASSETKLRAAITRASNRCRDIIGRPGDDLARFGSFAADSAGREAERAARDARELDVLTAGVLVAECPSSCRNGSLGKCPQCFDGTGMGCNHGDVCRDCRAAIELERVAPGRFANRARYGDETSGRVVPVQPSNYRFDASFGHVVDVLTGPRDFAFAYLTLGGFWRVYMNGIGSPAALCCAEARASSRADYFDRSQGDTGPNVHQVEGDCTIDAASGCCSSCGVEAGEPCASCSARSFHRPGCPDGAGLVAAVCSQVVPAVPRGTRGAGALGLALLVMAMLAPSSSADANGAVSSPRTRFAVNRAILAAAARLEAPACAAVLADFADASGRSLDLVLATAAPDVTAAEFLRRWIFYTDGTPAKCGHGVAFYTSPGSRVVAVCDAVNREPLSTAPVLLVHELAHVLGQAEAPAAGAPTSAEITARVAARCGK